MAEQKQESLLLFELDRTAPKSVLKKGEELKGKVEVREDHYEVAGEEVWFLQDEGVARGYCSCDDFERAISEAKGGPVKPCPHLVAVGLWAREAEAPEAAEAPPLETPQVPAPDVALVPVADVGWMNALYEQCRSLIRGVMNPGIDDGPVPGTNNRPILLKPGAEKILRFFGLRANAIIDKEIEDWAKPFFYYRFRIELFRDDKVVAVAYGSANSRESKWAYRWVPEAQLPKHLDKEQLPKRLVGAGKVVLHRVPNDDIYSLVDTIQKMALKRALVAAVRTATAASAFFEEEFQEETG